MNDMDYSVSQADSLKAEYIEMYDKLDKWEDQLKRLYQDIKKIENEENTNSKLHFFKTIFLKHKKKRQEKELKRKIRDIAFSSQKIISYLEVSEKMETDYEVHKKKLSSIENKREKIIEKLIEILLNMINFKDELAKIEKDLKITEDRLIYDTNLLESLLIELSKTQNDLIIVRSHIEFCDNTLITLNS